jgi:hypothetical protein
MSRIRQWGWETLVFRAATALALVHALDDALVNRQPGVDLDHHALLIPRSQVRFLPGPSKTPAAVRVLPLERGS